MDNLWDAAKKIKVVKGTKVCAGGLQGGAKPGLVKSSGACTYVAKSIDIRSILKKAKDQGIPEVSRIKLQKDLAKGSKEFVDLMKKPRGVKAWGVLRSNPLIRNDIVTLNSVKNILNNGAVTSVMNKTELRTVVTKLAEKGVRCRTCPSGNPGYKYIDEVLDDLVDGAIKHGDNYKSVITGFKQGGSFTEGAMFVAEAVRKYGDDFPSGTVFEFTEVTAGGVRRVDVKVPNGYNGKHIFFEFKSVQDVPPSGFKTQFVKDLDLADVTDVRQIKWWFDGKKVESLPKDEMLDALENMNLNQNTIDKFFPGQSNVPQSQLVDEIELYFDQIFSRK